MHIFLAGLDNDFEQVRGEILRKEPVLGLEECYSLIRRKAVRRMTLNVEIGNTEATVMMTRNQPKTTKGTEKSKYKCTHYDQTGYTKERCYELVGYLEWWDHSRASRRKNSKNSVTAVTGTNDNTIKEGSALITTTDTCGKTLNVSAPVFNNAWIIEKQIRDYNPKMEQPTQNQGLRY